MSPSRKFALTVTASLSVVLLACNKAPETATPAVADSASFDPDGTAHVIRVVPMPTTVSPEAQQYLANLTKKSTAAQTLEQRRKATDEWRARQSAEAKRVFPVNIEETTTRECAPTSSRRSRLPRPTRSWC